MKIVLIPEEASFRLNFLSNKSLLSHHTSSLSPCSMITLDFHGDLFQLLRLMPPFRKQGLTRFSWFVQAIRCKESVS